MQDNLTKRIDVQIFTGIIGLGLVLVILKSFIFTGSPLSKSLTIEEGRMKMVSDFNKGCPFMMDNETRMDNVMPLPDNTIQYNYTLINWVKDSLNVYETMKGIELGIFNRVKTSPDLQIFRDEKVTMVYHISDKNGLFLFKIVVTPDMYIK